MLQPDKLKRLNDNATQMANAGSSQEDILAMKDAFIKQFGNETPLKKKEPSQLALEKKPSELSIQPTPQQPSSATGKPTKQSVSGISNGVPKPSKTVISIQDYKAQRASKEFSSINKKTEEDKISASKEVSDEFNDVGIVNKAATLAKSAWNSAADVFTAIGSLGSETKAPEVFKANVNRATPYIQKAKDEYVQKVKLYNQQVITNKSAVKPVYNYEDIKKRAFEIAVDEKASQKKTDRVNSYMENLDPEVQETILKKTSQEYKSTTPEIQKLFKSKSLAEQAALNSQNQLNELNTVINSYKSKGQVVPQDVVNNMQIAIKENEDNHKDAIELNDKYSDLESKRGDLKNNIRLFDKNYDFLTNTLLNTTAATLRLASGVYGGIDYVNHVQDVIARKVYGYNPALAANLRIKQAAGLSEKAVSSTISKLEEKAETPSSASENFGRYVVNEVIAKNAPMMASLAVGGGVGMGALVLGSAGESYTGMQKEMEEGKQYSDAQTAFIPLANAAVDAALFAFDAQLLKGAQRTIKSATQSEMNVMAKSALDQLLSKPSTYKEVGKKVVKKQLHGLAMMDGTIIAKNVIARVGGVDPNRDLLEGTKDASAISLVLVGIMDTAPHLVAKAVSEVSLDNRGLKASNNVLSLEKQLSDPLLSADAKAIIEKQHFKAVDNLNSIVKKQIADVSSLSEKQYKEVLDRNNEINKLKEEAIKIKTDENLTPELQKQMLDSLADSYSEAVNRKKELLNNGAKAQFERLDIEEQNALKEEANKVLNKEFNEDGTREYKPTEDEVVKKAISIKNEEALKAKEEPKVLEVKLAGKIEIIKENKIDDKVNNRISEIESILAQNNAEFEKTGQRPLLEEARIELENELKKLKTPEAEVVTPIAETTEVKQIAKKYKLTEKGQAFNVENKNGKLEVTKSDGSKVSKPTERAVLRKHADNYDFTQGEKAVDRMDFEGQDWDNEVAKKSNNPSEVAEAVNYASFEDISNLTPEERTNYKDGVIFDGLDKITEKGFYDSGDRNKKTSKTAKEYFSEEGRKIDDLADELSRDNGIEITPKDIADFIERHPNGKKEFKTKQKENLSQEQIKKNNTAFDLKNKFTELTGLPATPEFLLKAVEQATRKFAGHDTLDQLSDAQLEAKYNELKQFEEEQYGKQAEKVIETTKRVDEVKDIKDGGEVQEGVEKVGITKENLKELEKDYELELSKRRDKISDEELAIMAKNLIESGYNIDGLVKKSLADEKYVPTDLELNILAEYAADMKGKIDSNSSDADIAKYRDILSAINRGTSEAGRALRMAKVKKDVIDSIADVMSDMMDDYNVDSLTKEQRVDAEARFKIIERSLNEHKEALDKVTAELERLKGQKTTYTQEDFDVELQKAKDDLGKNYDISVFENLKRQARKDKLSDIKEDLKLAKEKVLEDIRKVVRESRSEMSANPVSKPIEFTALVAKLAKIYIQEGALSLEEVANNIYNDLKDMSKDISKESIINALKSKPKRVMSEATKRKIYISLLNKNIESLDTQIQAKKRDIVTNTDKYKRDVEIKELRDKRDSKKEELAKIDPSYAESRKLETDLKLAQNSLEEYQRRINENDLTPREKEPKIVAEKLKKLRQLRDAKKKEYLAKKKKFEDSLKEPAILPTKEELENKKYLSEVDSKIKSLNKRIEDLKENKQKDTYGKSTVWNEKISELENELRDLRDLKKQKGNKKESKNELMRQKYEIQQEQKLLIELEKLERGEQQPKTERKKVEKNQRLTELRAKIKELTGEDLDEKFIQTAKQRIKANEVKANKINDKIKSGDFSKEQKPQSILDIELLQKNNKELYEDYLKSVEDKHEAMYNYELSRQADKIKNGGAWSKINRGADIAINTSKGTVAMFDQSVVLVQSLVFSLSHPLKAVKFAKQALAKDFISAKEFNRKMTILKENRPLYDLIKKTELAILDPRSLESELRSELHGGDTNLWNKEFEFKGKKYSVGQAFERSTSSFLNNARLSLFMNGIEKLYQSGKTFENAPNEFKSLARAINELTGQGKVQKQVQMASPIVNKIIWSTKMFASTLNILGLGDIVRPIETSKAIGRGLGFKIKETEGTKGFYTSLTPTQRKFAAKELGRFIGTGALIMTIAALNGADVDLDPRSSGFGSIIIGNKKYNVYGRFSSAARTIVQVAGGVRVIKGEEVELGKKFGSKTSGGVVYGSFVRGKMTPSAGLAADLILNNQKNYFTSEDIDFANGVKTLTIPMSVQDLKKDFTRDDALTATATAISKAYGANISDERDFAKQKKVVTPISISEKTEESTSDNEISTSKED